VKKKKNQQNAKIEIYQILTPLIDYIFSRGGGGWQFIL
jgi:hypothetical protein